MNSRSGVTLQFDEFKLDLDPPQLRKGEDVVQLQAQPLRLLVLLASRAGDVVTHEEIRKYLWNDQIVDFSRGVHVCIRQIRTALDHHNASQQYIENVPRRGYRFIAEIRDLAQETGLQKVDIFSSWRVPAAGVTVFVALGVAAVILSSSMEDLSTQHVGVPTPNALDQYARGRYILDSGKSEAPERSRAFFLEAVEADPSYAAAFAAVAETFQMTGDIENARTYAQKALALDPTLPEAHLRIAATLAIGDWKWRAAEERILKALELDSASAEAHHALASIYSVTGRLRNARDEMEISLSIDPVSTLLRADYGLFLYYAGDYKGAREQCSAALELDPSHSSSIQCLYRVASLTGNYEEAVTHAADIMTSWEARPKEIDEVKSQPSEAGVYAFEYWRLQFYQSLEINQNINPIMYAFVFASLGETDKALSWLEKAVDEHNLMVPFVLIDPVFSFLRNDKRFKELLARTNIQIANMAG